MRSKFVRSQLEIMRDILESCRTIRLQEKIIRKTRINKKVFDSISKNLLERGLLETEIAEANGKGAGGVIVGGRAYRIFFKATKAGTEFAAEVNKLTEMIT